MSESERYVHPQKRNILNALREDKKNGVELLEREKMMLEFDDLKEDLVSIQEYSVTKTENFHPDGSIILRPGPEFPGDTRHSPKSFKMVLNDYDRVFWVNILIACEGQSNDEKLTLPLRPRSNCKLKNTTNDLEAFLEFYAPPLFGDLYLIDKYKTLRSAGFFQSTEKLLNPTIQELEVAIMRLKKWIDINTADPEFTSVQINFCFAGHAGVDINADSSIELFDQAISAKNIAKLLCNLLPCVDVCDNSHRLDMFLDCCHAAAVAFDISTAIKDLNNQRVAKGLASSKESGAPLGGMGLGRLFCSSMQDEPSLESDEYKHGLFTYAFLNEFSAKPVCEPGMPNLALRDVGWFSGGKQHPFFISFLKGANPQNQDFLIKFPSLKYFFAHIPISYRFSHFFVRLRLFFRRRVKTKEVWITDDQEFFYKQLESRRKMVAPIEKKLHKNSSKRLHFDKNEYLEQEIHWF